MFVFDVTKQCEKLKNSVTDIQIKAQFSANVAANTEASAVVINDKSLIFQSDGQKMRVEYEVKKIYHNINENLDTNDDFSIERKYQRTHSYESETNVENHRRKRAG